MKNAMNRYPIVSFTVRFAAVHTLTYLAFGVVFMLACQYFMYFKGDPLFSLVMKSSDELSVRLAPLIQVFRGALLALAIFPFREVIIGHRQGWPKLFLLLFVLTSIGAVITGPGSIEGFLYTQFSFNPFIGYPEIALQMLTSSWLFCKWEEKKYHNRSSADLA